LRQLTIKNWPLPHSLTVSAVASDDGEAVGLRVLLDLVSDVAVLHAGLHDLNRLERASRRQSDETLS
jgi:hypothetical protein